MLCRLGRVAAQCKSLLAPVFSERELLFRQRVVVDRGLENLS